MAQEIPVTQARAQLSELVNQVGYGGERVVLTRHGRPVAALVSATDYALYEQWAASQDGEVAEVQAEAPAIRSLRPDSQQPDAGGAAPYRVAATYGGGVGGSAPPPAAGRY